ncbi:YkyA family protein [Bacillus alkalicellulosilyticus]|uniref:YkyA family protein n=1 Tax=Alkalihalobacterium alkalicellulosilyticum TaxID=1912214 RepID=UPI0009964C0F|nr:YkyA family protein [Bacillus alkalicellulosilyticus]
MAKNKGVLYVVFGFCILFITACGTNPAETMFQHMEEAVALEKEYENQQQPLVEAEKKEHEIYEQIIMLGMEEFDDIYALSEQAIAIVEERRELMNAEKQSIDAGFEEFIKIEAEIENLNEDIKGLALEMKTAMEERYQSYQSLFEEYNKALDLDKVLYEMLQSEDATIDELQNQIDQINLSYETVIELKDIFNEQTVEYNQLKRDFYDAAEINVEFE